jgi:K+-sensing histidine kinase KdpD
MFRFAAGSNESRLLSVATRYEIAIASVVGAFAVVFLLQRFGVRDPFALIFLAAIAISFWCGGTGPGILGIILSLIGLNAFLHSPNGWFHIALI